MPGGRSESDESDAEHKPRITRFESQLAEAQGELANARVDSADLKESMNDARQEFDEARREIGRLIRDVGKLRRTPVLAVGEEVAGLARRKFHDLRIARRTAPPFGNAVTYLFALGLGPAGTCGHAHVHHDAAGSAIWLTANQGDAARVAAPSV